MSDVLESLEREAIYLQARGWTVIAEIKIDADAPVRFKVGPKKKAGEICYEELPKVAKKLLEEGHDVMIRMARKELALDRDHARPRNRQEAVVYHWKVESAAEDVEARGPSKL